MQKENKIGILTFHSAQNYGAVLQCFATTTFLKKHSFQAEVINYQNKALKERYAKVGISYYLNPKNIYRSLKYNSHFTQNETFNRFIHDRLDLSKKYYDESNFQSVDDDYNIFIVGSDQVWNLSCNGNDENYFLTNIGENKTKIALSVSCGGKVDQLDKKLISEIKKFKSISIREKDDCEKLKLMLNTSNIQTLIDPVFLLNQHEWLEIADESIRPKKPYIFIYMVFEDKNLIKYVKQHYKGHQIYYINQGKINVPGVINLRNVSPEQFISLIYSADLIFTNSFHGLAFSLIFNKKFGVKLLEKNTSINNRILCLLSIVNATDHLIESERFRMDEISNKYEEERKKLIDYLLNNLNDISNH